MIQCDFCKKKFDVHQVSDKLYPTKNYSGTEITSRNLPTLIVEGIGKKKEYNHICSECSNRINSVVNKVLSIQFNELVECVEKMLVINEIKS